MRLFIAIEIPADIKRNMTEIQHSLKGSGVDASWTRAEGIHLTLKFLGEVAESRVPDIMNGLRHAAKGVGSFRLGVSGVGTFPNPGNARVVWVGLSGDIENLLRLQGALDEEMAGIGFERDKRKFTAHLTLGRIKYIRSRDQWFKALDAVKDITLAGLDVTTISLMKSELKSSGAVYTEMGKVTLQQVQSS